MFPQEYRGAIFIAEHGSWNRTPKIGYRVTVVKLDATATRGATSLSPKAGCRATVAWAGRSTCIVAPDGALLVSDDNAGAVYRIDYSNR